MALSTNDITIFAVVQEDPLNPGNYIVTHQSNLPQLNELVIPSGTWNWSVDNVSGFLGGPAFYFTPSTGGTGAVAELGYNNIHTNDFLTNNTGEIEISLFDDGPTPQPPQNYFVNIHLRYIVHKDFTVFAGQSLAGSNPPSAPPHDGGTFFWDADDLPASISSIMFDADGRINVTHSGTYSTEETFTLIVGNARFEGATVKLRQLVGDGYTFFETQSACAPSVTPVDTSPSGDNYVFNASFSPTFTGAVAFDQYGAVTAITGTVAFDGSSDQAFDLEIVDTSTGISRPSSSFIGTEQRKLKLRNLFGRGHVFVENQTASSACVTPIDTSPTGDNYYLNPSFPPSFPGACAFDQYGALTGVSGPIQYDGSSDTLFDLEITDNSSGVSRPVSFFSGVQQRQMKIRRLQPVGGATPLSAASPIRIKYDSDDGIFEVSNGVGEDWHIALDSESMDFTDCAMGTPPDTHQARVVSPAPTRGDHGAATFTAQFFNGGSADAPACTVTVPISVDLGLYKRGSVGNIALPAGRARMRYQAELEADSSVISGETFTWEIEGGDSDVTGALELVPDSPTSLYCMLQTQVNGSSDPIAYLPDVATAGTKTVQTVIRKWAGGDVVAQSDPINFIMCVDQTKANVNVAVLLDNSGSMKSSERWTAASSGAGAFATMVSEAGTSTHKMGIYWFNSGASSPDAVTSITDAAQKYRIGNAPGGTCYAVTDAAAVESSCTAMLPAKLTGLGDGLIHCKSELRDADAIADAERVVMLLSDGMENQTPKAHDIFTQPAHANYWFDTDGGAELDGPRIRLYPLALMTSNSWTDKLADMVEATGGIPELDMTHIPTFTDGSTEEKSTAYKVHQWYFNMFKSLFNFAVTSAPEDPRLSRGQVATEVVPVHSGQTKVIFYATHNDASPANWRFSVKPAGCRKAITKEIAQVTDGISYYENSYCTMMIVSYPIKAPGMEQCWNGQWQMVLERVGKNHGYYVMGAMAKEKYSLKVDVSAKGKATPGKKIFIRASFKDNKGRVISNARMTAKVTAPTLWLGDQLSQAGQRTPETLVQASKLKDAASQDMERTTDKYFNKYLATKKVRPNLPRNVAMRHIGKGVYVGSFVATSPGEHHVDVTCKGARMATMAEVKEQKRLIAPVLKSNAARVVQEYVANAEKAKPVAEVKQTRVTSVRRTIKSRGVKAKTVAARTRVTTRTRQAVQRKITKKQIQIMTAQYQRSAMTSLIRSLSKKQRFNIEYRESINVAFVPSQRHSEVFGYMEDRDTICLHVEPRDKYGHLLGPGYADRIYFTTPAGLVHRWPAKDMNDGSYEVEVPFKGGTAKIDVARTVLVGRSVAMKHPACRSLIRPKQQELGLKNFGVTVMGVNMPITVFAMAGNKNTKLVHLLNCKQLGQLDDADLIWFEDIKDVTKHKYTPCPKCMLLPPRLRPVKPKKVTPKPVRNPAKPAKRAVRRRVKR